MGKIIVSALEIVQDKRLTLMQIRVLLALFSFRGKNTNLVWPKRNTLGELLGYSENNITKVTTQLVDLGWLKKVGNGGRGVPVHYEIVPPDFDVETQSELDRLYEDTKSKQDRVIDIETQSELDSVIDIETQSDLDSVYDENPILTGLVMKTETQSNPATPTQSELDRVYTVNPILTGLGHRTNQLIQHTNEHTNTKNMKTSELNNSCEEVFLHWQIVMSHSQSKLLEKRKKLIEKTLKSGYSVIQMKLAIDGHKKSKWHMENGVDGIEYSLKPENLDRFIKLAEMSDSEIRRRNGRDNIDWDDTSWADGLQAEFGVRN